MFGHLRSLIPGKRTAKAGRKSTDGFDQAIANCFGGVVVLEVHEHDVAAASFHQRPDGRLVEGSCYEVAFSMSGDCAILSLGWSLGDVDHGGGESARAVFGAALWLAAGVASAEGGENFSFEGAAALDIERLVDRFVRHTHLRIRRKVLDQSVADLLGWPFPRQLSGHVAT